MEIKHIFLALKRNNVLGILIVLQIALTLMMVSNSIFITLKVLEGWLTPTGLDQENMVVAWNKFYDPQMNMRAQIEEDLKTLRELPGVAQVTPVVEAPFESSISFRFSFDSAQQDAQRYPISLLDMDHNGKEVLNAELLAGRWFRPEEVAYGHISDIVNPPVVLISETLAKVMYPDGNALGQTLYLASEGREGAEIIGIYKDFMGGDMAVYRRVPYQTVIRPQVAWGVDYVTNYLIRTEAGAAPGLLDIVETTLYETRGRYIASTEVLTRTHKRLYDGRSSFAFTMLGISLIGIVITSLGIIGLVGLSISQRQKQIGTRRALGATRWQVIRYFLIENSLLTFVGLALGLLLSYGLNYILVTEYNNEGLIKWHYWIWIGLGLWAVNLIATRVPAQRAARIDPAIVTRTA